jgi:serine/threonine protein phosphatase PrpC
MASRRIWAATDKGPVRPNNEDNFASNAFISACQNRVLWDGLLDADGGWAAVADGMGGHEAGEIASHLVLEALQSSAEQMRNERSIVSTLNQVNRKLYEQLADGTGRPGMGSTVVGLIFVGTRCHAFNLGDSRAYLKRGAALAQISIDHTMKIDESGDFGRSHALTQCLGGTRRPVLLFPDIKSWQPQPDDLILLCSDGLTDAVSDIAINEIMGGSVSDTAATLIDAAIDAGASDNVTAIVVGPEVSGAGG